MPRIRRQRGGSVAKTPGLGRARLPPPPPLRCAHYPIPGVARSPGVPMTSHQVLWALALVALTGPASARLGGRGPVDQAQQTGYCT